MAGRRTKEESGSGDAREQVKKLKDGGSYYINAAAGTGKTQSLAERVVEALSHDVPEVEEEVRSLLADAALKSLTVSSTGAGSVKRYAKLPKDVKKLLSQTSASISNNRMSSVA